MTAIPLITTKQLIDNLRHNQGVEMDITDHEGGTWMLSFQAAEDGSEFPDAVEYHDPEGNEDVIDADAFIALHAQYTWTIDGVR